MLEDGENGRPTLAGEVFAELYARLCSFDQQIADYDGLIAQLAQTSVPARRLMQAVTPFCHRSTSCKTGGPYKTLVSSRDVEQQLRKLIGPAIALGREGVTEDSHEP